MVQCIDLVLVHHSIEFVVAIRCHFTTEVACMEIAYDFSRLLVVSETWKLTEKQQQQQYYGAQQQIVEISVSKFLVRYSFGWYWKMNQFIISLVPWNRGNFQNWYAIITLMESNPLCSILRRVRTRRW